MTQIKLLKDVSVRAAVLAIALFCGMASCASAAFIEEYFNGYGTTSANLSGRWRLGSGLGRSIQSQL